MSQQSTIKLFHTLEVSSFQKLLVLSTSIHCLPPMIKLLAFIWSQFQLLSLLARTVILSLFDSQTSEALYPVILVEKYLFSTNLFDGNDLPKLTAGILTLAFIYLIIPVLTAIGIFYALNKGFTVPDFVLIGWKAIIDLHLPLVFFPLHINTVQLILNFTAKEKESIRIWAFIVLICNLILALSLTILCNSNLKTQNALSSKTNTLNILDFFAKTLLPFFIYYNDPSISKAGKAILMILIVLYCLCRDSMFLRILPFYRLRTLKVASITHAVITSMVLAGIWARIFWEAHNQWEQYRVMVLFWVIFGPGLIKLYKASVENRLLKIVQNPEKIRNAYDLVHYWEVYKFYEKYGLSEVPEARFPQTYFDFWSITAGYLETNITKEARKKMFYEKNIELLKEFIRRYPHESWLVELALAKIYAKEESSSILASHIVRSGRNRNFLDQTSLLIIKLKILKKMAIKHSQETLGVTNFIQTQAQYKTLRMDMIKNIEYHLKFWKTFSSAKPNFVKMIELAKKNIISSKKLNSISYQYKDFSKIAFSEPLLIISIYCYFFKDEVLLAESILKEYFQTEQKARQRQEKNDTDSLKFTSEAIHLVISPEQNKVGEILDCSGRVNAALGYPKELLIGKSINILFPQLHNSLLKPSTWNHFLNKTSSISVLAQDGYLRPGIFHISLNYIQGFDLCYNLVLECVEENTRVVTLEKNSGTILNYSENFAKDLGFRGPQDQLNIKDICPNFRKKSFALKSHDGEEEEGELYELAFFPYWSHEGVNPIIYKAKIKKIEMGNNGEMFTIKMQKLSSFSFIPPPPKDTKLTSRRDSERSPSRGKEMTLFSLNQKTFNTRLQTQTQDVLSPRSTTHRLLSPRSPREEKLFEFAKIPLSNMTMTRGLTIDQPGPMNGDEDSYAQKEEEDEEIATVGDVQILNNTKREEKEEDEIDPHKDDILEDIFRKSATESGNGRLENTKSIQRRKIVKRLVQDRSPRTEKKLYFASFAVTCLTLLTLLIWLNFYTSRTSKNVTRYSDALQNGYALTYWIKVGTQDMLYYLATMMNWVSADLNSLAAIFRLSFSKFSYFNRAYEQSVSLANDELQGLHYEKNVRIYDRDIDYAKELIAYDNIFQATNRIVDRGMINYQRATTGYDFQETINQDSYFIFDNTLNDLQVQQINLIVALEDHLFNIFESSRSNMVNFMGVTFGVVFLFLAFSLKYIITVNLEFKRFMTFLYTLRKPDIKHIEKVSGTFKELLEKDSQDKGQYLDLYHIEKHQANVDDYKENTKRGNYFDGNIKGSYQRVFVRNLLFLLGLLVFTGATIGFAMVYYKSSSEKLTIMKKQQINIYAALDFLNSLSWVSTELHMIALFNFTLSTRNADIYDSILADIEKLTEVNALQSSLRNYKDEFSPAMRTILFNFSCAEAYSPYYSYSLDVLQPECESISNGENYVGLLEIATKLGMLLSADVPAFYEGTRDLAALQAFENKIIETYRPYINIQFVLLLLAYVVGIGEFNDLVEELKVIQVKLAWIAVTFSFLLGIVTWIFIMRRIARLDFESKEILSFVPTRLLLKNPQLKRYLVRTAKSDDTMAWSLLR